MRRAWPRSLVLAGAGKMGGALLRGWLSGGMDPATIHVVDPYLDPETLSLCETNGVSLAAPSIAPAALVLAVKPQTFSAAPGAFAPMTGPGTTVVSILAGKTLANLRAGLPDAGAIVRAMPNLPASVGRGASGLAGESRMLPDQQAVASTLLDAVGHIEWLDEGLIDAVTAVSGSGPAYVFFLAECLAEAGVAAGLPPDVAARLARATVEGAGELMSRQTALTPGQLRAAVTSPGGTTAAALDVLRGAEGLLPLITTTVAAANNEQANWRTDIFSPASTAPQQSVARCDLRPATGVGYIGPLFNTNRGTKRMTATDLGFRRDTDQLSASPRLFENPVLDKLSRVHWTVPLCVYTPIILGLIALSLTIVESVAVSAGMVALGYAIWTLIEYFGHRYLFHWEFPGDFGQRLHFMIHGVHHDHPNDPLRLVMPILLSGPIMIIAWFVASLLFGETLRYAGLAGFVLGYLAYDMVHFYTHHAKPTTRLGLTLRRLHLMHHFRDHDKGFGVSAPYWDFVFGTAERKQKRDAR